ANVREVRIVDKRRVAGLARTGGPIQIEGVCQAETAHLLHHLAVGHIHGDDAVGAATRWPPRDRVGVDRDGHHVTVAYIAGQVRDVSADVDDASRADRHREVDGAVDQRWWRIDKVEHPVGGVGENDIDDHAGAAGNTDQVGGPNLDMGRKAEGV